MGECGIGVPEVPLWAVPLGGYCMDGYSSAGIGTSATAFCDVIGER
jgi:hypothetical protein